MNEVGRSQRDPMGKGVLTCSYPRDISMILSSFDSMTVLPSSRHCILPLPSHRCFPHVAQIIGMIDVSH